MYASVGYLVVSSIPKVVMCKSVCDVTLCDRQIADQILLPEFEIPAKFGPGIAERC